MFCPLCKAEYRDGFTQCSDCHIALVPTTEEAATVEVVRLWTGDNRKRMERILDSLTDSQIPFHSRELVKSTVWPWLSMLLWQFIRPWPTSEFHVDVFQKDLMRAEEMVRAIEKEEDFDSGDDEGEESIPSHRELRR